MITFRSATRSDLPALVAMLADDVLGATRESPGEPLHLAYNDAFSVIDSNPEDRILLAELSGSVVGMLQLTFLPGLSRRGMWRAQIEGVRVASSARGEGVGRALMQQAIALSQQRGCGLIQLTTDHTRQDAKRFYTSLGFTETHAGMKLRNTAS